jgi:Rnl2 family RNA ligase
MSSEAAPHAAPHAAAAAWSRYPKIPHAMPAEAALNTRELFIATEKLHGANFSVFLERSRGVQFAKRSGVLLDTEDFFSFRSRRLDAALRHSIARLWSALATAEEGGEGLVSVAVYGEMIGGKYPHPEVMPVKGLSCVQRGVWYSPDLVFVAFDVTVGKTDGSRDFLDFARARELCVDAGFTFVEPLAEGPFHTLVSDFDIRFTSTVPKRLGLPALEGPNLAEGIVIRSAREVPDPRKKRQCVKRKIPEFAEARYDNPEWKAGRSGGASTAPPESEVLRYELLANVTQQRLANAVSKHGRLDPNDRDGCRQLLRAFEEDVLEALVEDGHLGSATELVPGLRAELHESAIALMLELLRDMRRDAKAEAAEAEMEGSCSPGHSGVSAVGEALDRLGL